MFYCILKALGRWPIPDWKRSAVPEYGTQDKGCKIHGLKAVQVMFLKWLGEILCVHIFVLLPPVCRYSFLIFSFRLAMSHFIKQNGGKHVCCSCRSLSSFKRTSLFLEQAQRKLWEGRLAESWKNMHWQVMECKARTVQEMLLRLKEKHWLKRGASGSMGMKLRRRVVQRVHHMCFCWNVQ